MGGTSWSNDAYKHIKTANSNKSTNQIFVNNTLGKASNDMLPKGVKFRECRDSDAHPMSFGVMVYLDVTGSMGRIPEVLVREKLGTLMETLIEHGINDAQVLFGAIGDHHTDNFPLQVSQFESGTTELNKWLSSTYIEGNGGGQRKESYLLGWLFASRHTSMDCFEKRGQKGVLFTIGDEASWSKLESDRIKDLMGYSEAQDISDEALLAEAQRTFHVFHIHVSEGSYANDPDILGYWKDLLHERLIICKDYTQIAELIATTVAVIHGIDMDKFTSTFDSKTASDVKTALAKINTGVTHNDSDKGVVKL